MASSLRRLITAISGTLWQSAGIACERLEVDRLPDGSHRLSIVLGAFELVDDLPANDLRRRAKTVAPQLQLDLPKRGK